MDGKLQGQAAGPGEARATAFLVAQALLCHYQIISLLPWAPKGRSCASLLPGYCLLGDLRGGFQSRTFTRLLSSPENNVL